MRTSIKVLAFLLGSPLGAIATGSNDGCSHNNCLRAVIAEAFTTRDGRGDCSKYLRVTVTPATSTIVSTVTEPALATATTTIVEGYTDVETIVASTETQYSQVTTVVEEILTVTETAFTTRTVDPLGNPGKLKAKRQVTVSGSTFPAYASACTVFAKYTSACSCVGVFPQTLTASAPSTTITVTATSTSTSTLTTTTSTTTTSPLSITETTLLTSTLTTTTTASTATATTTSTSIQTNIVTNGRFNQGRSSWTITGDSQISASVTTIIRDGVSNNVLRTGNMFNNNLFEMKQTLIGSPGTRYNCRYDWYFTNHYETRYTNGNIYVPYVHIYINNDLFDNSTPQPPRSPGVWYTIEFSFVSSGSDILWFDCASPQARTGPGGGSNFLSLDNIACFAS